MRGLALRLCVEPAVTQYGGPSAFPSPAATGRTRNETIAVAHEAAEKAKSYLSQMKKPNMHVALHYQALATEYGLLVNFNVLFGEDKHT